MWSKYNTPNLIKIRTFFSTVWQGTEHRHPDRYYLKTTLFELEAWKGMSRNGDLHSFDNFTLAEMSIFK